MKIIIRKSNSLAKQAMTNCICNAPVFGVYNDNCYLAKDGLIMTG